MSQGSSRSVRASIGTRSTSSCHAAMYQRFRTYSAMSSLRVKKPTGLDSTIAREKEEWVRRDAASVSARILDAAQAEFIRVGYARANTNVMAENYGISKATIFRYFPTKEKLFEAVIQRIARRWHAHINWGAISEEDPRTWLRVFGVRALRWILMEETLFVGRMAIAEGPSHEEVRHLWPKYATDPILGVLIREFRKWQNAGLLSRSDARQRAVAFLDLTLSGRVSRALYGHAERSDDAALRRHVDACVEIFLKGCAARMNDDAHKGR